jgi:hypothetical protein
MTQQAEQSEFNEARVFIDQLISGKLLGSEIPRHYVFIVPGNHDVNWESREPATRFANYSTFYNSLFRSLQPDQRPFSYPDQTVKFNRVAAYHKGAFLVAEVNSCLYVARDTVEASRGFVDFETIAELRRQLDAFAGNSELIRIAIVHHHPVLLPAFVEPSAHYDSIVNAHSLIRLLRDHSFHIVLHGHKHLPQIFTYDPGSAWTSADPITPQLLIAGGSCSSKDLPKEAVRKCNTYNIINIKWNPSIGQARVQIITRGLMRSGPDSGLDPDQWKWNTERIFDRILHTHTDIPFSSVNNLIPHQEDKAEQERKDRYNLQRLNMPVVEVMPSLIPGQAYEARAWLVQHRPEAAELPQKVVWSAGRMFNRKVCEASSAPSFAVSFHYWGPMLIQAEIHFIDGHIAHAYVYARLPGVIIE